MSAILIDSVIQKHIDEAVERARLHPLQLTPEEIETLRPTLGRNRLDLKDRPQGFERKMTKEHVHIPFGYRAAISFEIQPEAGLCAHLSFSSGQPGRIPNEHALIMVANAFGLLLKRDGRPRTMWLEEFEPGHHAINIVEAVTWPPSGA